MSADDPIERPILVMWRSCAACDNGEANPDHPRCKGCITVQGKPGFREASQ
jgi:hypothetical protein